MQRRSVRWVCRRLGWGRGALSCCLSPQGTGLYPTNCMLTKLNGQAYRRTAEYSTDQSTCVCVKHRECNRTAPRRSWMTINQRERKHHVFSFPVECLWKCHVCLNSTQTWKQVTDKFVVFSRSRNSHQNKWSRRLNASQVHSVRIDVTVMLHPTPVKYSGKFVFFFSVYKWDVQQRTRNNDVCPGVHKSQLLVALPSDQSS